MILSTKEARTTGVRSCSRVGPNGLWRLGRAWVRVPNESTEDLIEGNLSVNNCCTPLQQRKRYRVASQNVDAPHPPLVSSVVLEAHLLTANGRSSCHHAAQKLARISQLCCLPILGVLG